MNLDCFGSGARFHHIGIAVSAINDVLPTCQITHDAMHGVNVAFVSLHGCCLELIEPSGNNSPVSGGIEKGIKLLHICYEVDDIEASLLRCRQYGFHVIRHPTPAQAFDLRRIAFVSSSAFGLVELLEAGEER